MIRVRKNKRAVLALAAAFALFMSMSAQAEYGPGMNQYNPYDPYNNPGRNTDWDYSSGPGASPVGQYSQSDREAFEENIYSQGPGSSEAQELLSRQEQSYYINSTYRGGIWQQLEDGRWKLLKADGQPVSSEWAYIDGKYYLLDMYGIMLTGFQWVNGNRYYFKSTGEMQTGWLLKEGQYYFLNADGTMSYGWVNTEGSWYYLDTSTGVMLRNTYTPDGRYVNAEGVLV